MDIFCCLTLNLQDMTWATYQAYTVDLSDHMISTNMLPEKNKPSTPVIKSIPQIFLSRESCYRRFISLKLKGKVNPATETTTKNSGIAKLCCSLLACKIQLTEWSYTHKYWVFCLGINKFEWKQLLVFREKTTEQILLKKKKSTPLLFPSSFG